LLLSFKIELNKRSKIKTNFQTEKNFSGEKIRRDLFKTQPNK
jgi:hypothetical protein